MAELVARGADEGIAAGNAQQSEQRQELIVMSGQKNLHPWGGLLQFGNLFGPAGAMLAIKRLLRIVQDHDWDYIPANLLYGFLPQSVDEGP